MYLTDFLYDGVKLSSLGYLVGSAVTSNNESASAGSKLDLQTVANHGNHLTGIVNATYSENITATFDIIKHACNDAASYEMDDNEIANMVRWLNRKEWHKFKPLYNDLSFPNVYFMGTFTDISTIMKGGAVVGLALTFTANAPYGFMEFEDVEFNNTWSNGLFTLYDESDEMGIHYPEKVMITLLDAGDFVMTNTLSGKTTKINNCKAHETIVLDCVNKIITSHMNEALVPTLTAVNDNIVSYTSVGTINNIWRVYDGNLTTLGLGSSNVNGTGTRNAYIGYHFSEPTSVDHATICWGNADRDTYSFTVKVQASHDGETWEDISDPVVLPQTTRPVGIYTNTDAEYEYFCIRYISYVCPTNIGYPQAHEIQFYGTQEGTMHPRLYNDFNYVYPALANTAETSKNVFEYNLPCVVKFVYKPIRKVGIIA